MNTNNPRTLSGSRRLVRSWNESRDALRQIFGSTSLPSELPSKEDCSSALSHLPSSPHLTSQAVSEAATLFQFRKCFPAPQMSKMARWNAYSEKMSRPSPSFTEEFDTAARLAVNLLPRNWDQSYPLHVQNSVPSLSSNLELSDDPSTLFGDDPDANFLSICLGYSPTLPIPPERRVAFPAEKGKVRTVTIASALQLQLLPLHRTLYAALSRRSILRGPATRAKMSRMRYHEGESFVSGDYQSATDNFNLSNTVRLIQLLRTTSTHIPSAIWDLATEFFSRAVLCYEDKKNNVTYSTVQQSGQLMGNILSFPLLCLTNLTGVVLGLGVLRTKQLIRDRLLHINGDDIVFRSTPTEYTTWRDNLHHCGLVLEQSKTLVHPTVFTLNSTFFKARATHFPRQVFFFRAASFITPKLHPTLLPHAQITRANTLLSALSSMVSPFLYQGRITNVIRMMQRNRDCYVTSPTSLSTTVPPPLQSELIPKWHRFSRQLDHVRPLNIRGHQVSLGPPPQPLRYIPRSHRPKPELIWMDEMINRQMQFCRRRAPIPPGQLTMSFPKLPPSLCPMDPLPPHRRTHHYVPTPNTSRHGIGFRVSEHLRVYSSEHPPPPHPSFVPGPTLSAGPS
uniref:Putative RdRp n=1 Tax=Leucocoprinus ourmiavirus B TaxID=2592720 RepID=A0A7G3KFG6_9VIRU|nr:putative RdRp [Leucocoprinus ourmiavirus B]